MAYLVNTGHKGNSKKALNLALGLISLLIFALVVYLGAKTNSGKYAEAVAIQPFYQAVIHTSQDST
ncbi:MAG: hypothetical protein ACKOBI_09750, partial [Bacteroidota bacterium]